MNDADLTWGDWPHALDCPTCNHHGELASGRRCDHCRGTGRRACGVCLDGPAVELSPERIPLCQACSDASRHAPSTVPCAAPSGMVANDCGVEDDESDAALLGALMQTALLLEVATEANVPIHEAARLVRKASAR